MLRWLPLRSGVASAWVLMSTHVSSDGGPAQGDTPRQQQVRFRPPGPLLLPFDAALVRRPRQSCGRRRRWTLTSFSAPPSSIESADRPAGLLSAFLRRLAPSLASSSSCPGPSRLVGSLDSSPPKGSAAAALRSHKTYYLHPERKSPKVYGILLRLTRTAAGTDPF